MRGKRLILLLLALLFLLPAEAAAAEKPDFAGAGLEGVLADYMERRGLNEDNFAMGWQDVESGRRWFFGADSYMVAGSMYKLPLNMVYYDLLASGEVRETDLVGGYQVETAMYASIVYSDNDAAQALRYGLGLGRDDYRNALARYSGISADALPAEYYEDNCMSPRFMLNTLDYLYAHAAQYEELIGQMKLAHPGRYFKKAEGEYEIAHKYGYFEGGLDDCAIVYTPRPFLLAAFLRDVPDGENALAELCALMTDYALYLEDQAEPTAAQLRQTESTRLAVQVTPEPVPAQEPIPAQEASVRLMAVGALGGIALLLALNRRTRLLGLVLALGALGVLLAGEITARPAAPAPEAAVTAAPESAPTPTPAPTPSPTPTPTAAPAAEKTEWVLSFAGDCTIGTLHEWQGLAAAHNMLYVVGENYGYPLENVRAYFEQDDFTLVNLEGTFTESAAAKSKDYRFRAGPEYARVLSLGGVEAAGLANNHAGDYGEQGIQDTRAALEAQGIAWTDETKPLIATLDGELKIGIMAFSAVEIDLPVGDVEGYLARLRPLYAQCAAAECDLVIAFLHWGWEYRGPESWMVRLAHALADLGCDMVVGSHPHILLPMEVYAGVPIFYSLGNFCYGGHADPADKDTVLVRQHVRADENGGYVLGETELVPCRISSVEGQNDFQPTPYAPDSASYRRVLEKLEIGQ
jgi:poly-gamma-glutamate synthesis protein (capsule biosynthesis protein)